MRTFLWVVWVLDQAAILIIAGTKLQRYELSEFTFRRRLAQYSGEEAKLFRQLYKNLALIRTFQKLEVVVLAALSVALLTHLLSPPVLGFIYALGGFLVIALLTKLSFVEKLSSRAFDRSREFILWITELLKPFLKVISSNTGKETLIPGSYEEFSDLLRRLPSTVLDPTQRHRLESAMEAKHKTVKDIMTPKKRAVIVEPSATLGPIVLSDLQKSGHGYFPVATKKGEPEGVLTLSDAADIQTAKQRSSVRDLMSPHVAWVEESVPLYELAAAFLEEKQYLILVRNLEGEFSGLVTIADLMKHLVGVVKE